VTGPGAADDAAFDIRTAASGPGGALADRLLQAHRRVREADLSSDDRARAAKRLIAISDASKHDLDRASQRLDAFLADLDEGRVSAS
jgi:hypothetical protein